MIVPPDRSEILLDRLASEGRCRRTAAGANTGYASGFDNTRWRCANQGHQPAPKHLLADHYATDR